VNRWDRVGLLFSIAMLSLIVLGLTRVKTNTEDVLQWLPDQSDARVDYNFFREHFNSDDFVILTWEGCNTQDPRLTFLADRIRDLAGEPANPDEAALVAEVTTGLDMTRKLSDKLNISRKAVMRRLKGVFFGLTDLERTCVLVELSHAGTAKRSQVMLRVFEAIESTKGLSRSQVSIAGYPFIATYIDEQLSGSYRTLLIPAIILATIISLLCLRNWRLGGIVFVTAVGAAAASVAITPICGYQLGGLMSIIPALVFVLATSGAIHLIRYSLDCIGDPAALLRVGWKPCVISTATTAVGMLSLLRSEFPAIRNFGLFCAVGVCFALAFQLTMVPWLLDRLGQPGLVALKNRRQQSSFWGWLAKAVKKQRLAIAVVFLGLLVVGIAGLKFLTAQVEVEKLFRPESQIVQSLTELETTLGPMDQTELLLIFDEVESAAMYQRIAFIRELQNELKKNDRIEVAYSLVNFLPTPPKRQSARTILRRAAYREFIEKNRENFSNGTLLAVDKKNTSEIWRISIRFPFIENVDFEAARESVMAATERVSERVRMNGLSQALDGEGSVAGLTPSEVVYTGQTYLFHHAQLTLLQDLFQNFVLAFVIITPMLVIVLRSVKIGLLAMLPNIFPTVAIYGTLGWSGHPVDLALAMTACVALGIAVDDTTHFLVRFRDFGGSLATLDGPIEKTIAQCGPAMWHTTLIASASLLTFYFSEMLVVSRFSWAIASLLVVALLADVLMLPAILFLLGKKTNPEAAD
jgi:predicted RND superfamily exporter protein